MLRLWLARSYANYLQTAFVVAVDKENAIQAGRKALRCDCTVTEIRVPGYSIRVELKPVQGKLW